MGFGGEVHQCIESTLEHIGNRLAIANVTPNKVVTRVRSQIAQTLRVSGVSQLVEIDNVYIATNGENMDYVISEKPEAVVATGERHLNGVEDVAFITVYFPKRIIAHVNVNWLSPVKVRTTLIGGEKKMLVWNDLEADEKLRVYDKGVSMSTNPSNLHQLLVSYRSGDMWAPQVEQVEALRAETAYFLKCINENLKPFNDGEAGLRVVRILEAADRSIRGRGEAITL